MNLKLKHAAAILCSLFLLNVGGCTSTAKHESTGQYVDNSSITLQVKAKLLADREVSSLPITVNSYKNSVQLSGFVSSRAQSLRAERLAASVPGVQVVVNNLIVQ